jgi:hypothetical protein
MKRIAAAARALPRAAMELCWMYAWSAFVLSLAGGGYGALEAVAVFFAAWALTAALRGRRLRLLVVVAAHGSALGWLAVLGGHAALYGEHALWPSSTPRAALAAPTAMAWLRCVLAVAVTAAFWRSGFRHAQRSDDYVEICRRFDRGLLWLFLLLFVRLLMRDQMPGPDRAGHVELLVFPYLFAGLVAVARARNRDVSVAHKRFLSGHRGSLLAAGFAGLIFLSAAAASLLALPSLYAASTAGARGLVAAGDPIRYAFLMLLGLGFGLLRWLATLFDPLPPPPPTDQSIPFQAPTGVEGGGLAGVDPTSAQWMLTPWIAACVVLALVYLYRRRTAGGRAAGAHAFDRLRAWLASLRHWLDHRRMLRRNAEAVRLYRALVRWGDRSGVTCRPSETPLEYAARLAGAMSAAQQPIDELVAAFNAHAYGRAGVSSPELRRARSALRRLRSPAMWSARARSWLRG